MTGLAIAIAVVSSMECLVEATGYPGLADDIRSGETWGGWTYSETTGAGAEVTMAFEATGDAVVTRNPLSLPTRSFTTGSTARTTSVREWFRLTTKSTQAESISALLANNIRCFTSSTM